MSERDKDEAGERGFVVVDRRGRPEEEAGEERAPAPSGPAPKPPAPRAEESSALPHAGELPALDFAGFVHSIAISVLHHLGLVAEPETGKPATPDLALARQNIDILEMLQAKTRGNLDPEEDHLLESLLYELRMRFVEVSGGRSE